MTEDIRVFPWGTSRRFNSYAGFFQHAYGVRLQKVAIDAGFTCPNRDGLVGVGGCTYCNNKTFNPSYCSSLKPVLRQIEEGIEFHKRRYRKAQSYLAYFQAYSNTYAPLSHLQALYQQALDHPDVVGLIVGTRPDCIDEEKLAYFEQLAHHKFVAIEYGIESCYDHTLQRINRGHTFGQSSQAITQTAGRGIHVGAHMMLGLPGESKQDMLASAAILSQLPLDSIKFHQLQIVRGTAMATEYERYPHDFVQFGLAEYIDFFIDFLEQFNPRIIIERFAGEMPPRFLVNPPAWGLVRNEQLVAMLEQRLEERQTWQGRLYLPH